MIDDRLDGASVAVASGRVSHDVSVLPRGDEWLGELTTNGSLSRQGLSALGTVGVSQLLKLLVNVVGSLVLVRILDPSEFGLAAMSLIVVNTLLIFRDMGLSTATTQMETISHRQASTLFWIGQAVALSLCIVTLAAAPLIARVFGRPELVDAIRVVAIIFPIGSLASQHEALLRRNVKFAQLGVVDVASLAMSMVLTVVLARSGVGWWCLVLQKPMQMAMYAVGVWWRCSWRPSWGIDLHGVREPVALGLHLSASNLASVVSRSADNIAIGYYWGASTLGLYSKAYELLVGPLAQVASPIGQALQATLSRLRSDRDRYGDVASQALTGSLVILLPLGLLMSTQPDAVTRVLLGERWSGSAPIVGWFGIAVCYQLAGTVLGWTLITQQRGSEISRTTALSTVANVVGFVIAARHGAVAVAATYVLVGLVFRLPLLFFVATRASLFDRGRGLRAVVPPLVVAGVLMALFHFTNRADAGPVALIGQLMTGYLVMGLVMVPTRLGSSIRRVAGSRLGVA